MTDFGLQWVLSVISMLLLVIYRFHIIDHNVSWWLQILRQTLDSGKSLPFPDGVLINGQGHTTFNGDQGCLLHLAKHFCVSLKNKVHSINTSLPTIVPFFFFWGFQEKPTCLGYQMWAYRPHSTSGFRAIQWS